MLHTHLGEPLCQEGVAALGNGIVQTLKHLAHEEQATPHDEPSGKPLQHEGVLLQHLFSGHIQRGRLLVLHEHLAVALRELQLVQVPLLQAGVIITAQWGHENTACQTERIQYQRNARIKHTHTHSRGVVMTHFKYRATRWEANRIRWESSVQTYSIHTVSRSFYTMQTLKPSYAVCREKNRPTRHKKPSDN